MSTTLQGKVAIITGAASGIGQAAAELFVEEGAKVVVGDIQDELGRAVEAGAPDDILFVHADVTDEQAVEHLVAAAVDRFGRLDVMFNNAGVTGDTAAMLDVERAGFDAAGAMLVGGVVSGHRFAARQFIRQGTGGSIITTASAAGLQGGWAPVGYTVAKHAIAGIVRAATAEWAHLGIRSNAIFPGIVGTSAMARGFGVDEQRSDELIAFLTPRWAGLQPAGRIGRPQDIAGAALFLASDASEWVTGVCLPVDGGATAVYPGFAEANKDAQRAWRDYDIAR